MKLKDLTIIICAFILFASCDQTSTNASKKPQDITITGVIKNYKKDTFNISFDMYALLNQSTEKKIDIGDNGRFEIALKESAPLTGRLSFGRVMKGSVGHYRYIYLYLEPGDSLNITADVNNIEETLSFSGSGVDNNAYVNKEDYKFNSYEQRVQNNHRFIADKQPNDYKQTVDKIRDQKLKFLENYSENHDLSKKMVEIYRNRYINLAVTRKINYPQSHKNFNNGEAADLPSDYYEFMDDVTIASDLDNVGTGYMRSLNHYLTNKYAIAEKKGYDNSYPEYLESQLNGRPLYIYMAYYLNRDFRADIYNKFGKESPYGDIAKIVKERYGHLEGMLPGNSAPEVVLTDMEGNTKPLASYQGTYLYIDFWATWCKPCIREIPYIDQLKEEYKDENIQFVSISFDSEEDKQKWKDFVKERNLEDPQLWVDSKNHKIFSDAFNIQMIPRFTFIDDKGKIIDAKAPRPSDSKKVRSLINNQLSK